MCDAVWWGRVVTCVCGLGVCDACVCGDWSV